VLALVFSSGASVGFYQGDVLKLFDDIQNLRPTMFPSVPRLFNRLYEKVLATIEQAGGTSKTLFDWAYATKKEKLDTGVNPEHGLWDTVVFSKLRAKLGGRVRFIVTGSAPISANVYQFLQMYVPF
jgi:long-chain acyl-CoA synthetase